MVSDFVEYEMCNFYFCLDCIQTTFAEINVNTIPKIVFITNFKDKEPIRSVCLQILTHVVKYGR